MYIFVWLALSLTLTASVFMMVSLIYTYLCIRCIWGLSVHICMQGLSSFLQAIAHALSSRSKDTLDMVLKLVDLSLSKLTLGTSTCHVCLCVYVLCVVYVCTHMCMYVCVCMCMCTCMCVCACMCVFVCACMCVSKAVHLQTPSVV